MALSVPPPSLTKHLDGNSMRTVLLVIISFLFTISSKAQLVGMRDQKSAKGSFYVAVDDAATLFVNGEKVFHATVGQSKSRPMELKTGDRFVVHLRDDGGVKKFVVLFASTDGRSVVSFTNRDFKIVPDLDVTDFTPEQFQGWSKYAKQLKLKSRRGAELPIKSYSEALWGDLNRCILACKITPEMFSQRLK